MKRAIQHLDLISLVYTYLEQSLHLVPIVIDDWLLREGVRHHFIGADDILVHDHVDGWLVES